MSNISVICLVKKGCQLFKASILLTSKLYLIKNLLISGYCTSMFLKIFGHCQTSKLLVPFDVGLFHAHTERFDALKCLVVLIAVKLISSNKISMKDVNIYLI